MKWSYFYSKCNFQFIAIDICAEMASLQQEIYLLIDNFKSIKVKLGSDLNGKKIASQDITLSEEKDDDDIPPQEADRNT